MAEETKPSGFGEGEDTFSLDDLDQILEQEDPGFNESLEEIKKESIEVTDSLEALGVDSDEEGDADGPGSGEEKEETRIEKLKKKIQVPINFAREFTATRIRAARNRLALWRTQGMEFIRHGLPERWKWFKSQVKTNKEVTVKALKDFWAKPLIERVAYLGIGTCVIGSLTFLTLTFVGNWLPEWEDPILAKYEDVGEKIGQYDAKADYIPLFDAFPEVEFPVRLDKIVVNLRRDSDSGSLPMGIFEFYLGVDSKDTAVEVRDREKQLIDIVQRTVEGFTYTQVMSYQGKVMLKARIRDNVNEALNQGQVNRVYINRMVTNH